MSKISVLLACNVPKVAELPERSGGSCEEARMGRSRSIFCYVLCHFRTLAYIMSLEFCQYLHARISKICVRTKLDL